MKIERKDLSIEFKIEMSSTEEESENGLEYEKHLVKEIESSCQFIVYVDKLDIKNEFTDDEELIKQKTKEEIIKYKKEKIGIFKT